MDRINPNLQVGKANYKHLNSSANDGPSNESAQITQEQRDELLNRIIARSRRALGYNALAPADAIEWLEEWAEILREIPTHKLEQAYTLAMRKHQDGPFAAHEVLQAFENLHATENRHYASSYEPAVGNCKACFGSGWANVHRKDPVSGLDGQAVYPCACERGNKYRRSYEKAMEG